MGQLNLLLTLDLRVSKKRNTVYTIQKGFNVVVGGRGERGMETAQVQECLLSCFVINVCFFYLKFVSIFKQPRKSTCK